MSTVPAAGGADRSRPGATGPVPALGALAAAHGVLTGYEDATGRRREASPESLVAVLRALGAPVDHPSQARDALEHHRSEQAREVVAPVSVLWDDRPAEVRVRLPAAVDGPLDLQLEPEEGEPVAWRVAVGDLPVVARTQLDGRDVVDRAVALPVELPHGYHTLLVTGPGGTRRSVLVRAPARCAPGPPGTPPRGWGVVSPLWSLRTRRSWGTADLTDLDALAAWAGDRGATVVGTLPLLAGFLASPCEASPYAPVSRRFWNEAYLDVERIPELEWSADARTVLGSAAVRTEIAALREEPLVDHARAMALKRRVLELLARRVADGPAAHDRAYRAYLLEHPEVGDYARFRAAGERLGADWRRWPARMRDGELRWGDVDPQAERYHSWCQWVAHAQLSDLAGRLAARGQVLYLDLPIGTHPDGYDVWRERHAFVAGVSVGAPPDAFFTGGQDWGFPPLHPRATRLDGHAHLRACLAHHLRVAGLLRIDHVMGLERSFWIPQGLPATEGVYVESPTDELWAVLCVESDRHGAGIVGENLGTVPPEVDEAMGRHGVRPMHVAQFALGPDDGEPVRPAPAGSVASWGSHDLPTFAGWWTGVDLDDRRDLGLFADAADEERERAARDRDRARLWRLADPAGDVVPDDAPRAVLDAVLTHLAEGDAAAVLVALEDLWLEPAPHNVPGTTTERPNWRRRARATLEELAADGDAAATLARVDAARPGPRATTRPDRRPAGPAAPVSLLTADDLHLFNEGRHFRLYDKLGAHPLHAGGVDGTYFAVWAPDAAEVAVTGDFDGWSGDRHRLHPVQSSGIWEGFVPHVGPGARYKYRVHSRHHGYVVDKADPFARAAEVPPRTASVVADLDYGWADTHWMATRGEHQRRDRPMSIYEVHLGSWRRVPEEGNRSLGYLELAEWLPAYVADLGFTHVELLPVMEHPFYGSWGYQVTGYFAPTARFGTPTEFMALVDALHQAGVGVILDWVPSHFPSDEHGLAYFDGSHLYEHADPGQRVHPEWQSYLFNYGRNEVRSFLVSNALFWLDRYHADGLRVDAVASMLYLDYSRRAGEWVPNRFGGRENLEAIELLRACNEAVYARHPDTVTIAEESTAWPAVSRPTYVGGLGFGFKWDMGWMHDTLEYIRHDPVHRSYHHDELTFRMVYAFTESFVLPLSHDEVVHGKGSLLAKMPGDAWQQFANLRLLLGYMYAMPGKKLLFMGAELAQRSEWSHDGSLDWHLLEHAPHAGVQRWVRTLNRLHRSEPALHALDCEPEGFEWIECHDREQSVFAFVRWDPAHEAPVVVVCNFTPVPRPGYRLGVPAPGTWEVVADSDAVELGGSGFAAGGDPRPVATDEWAHGRPWSVELALPPLGVVVLAHRA